MGAHALAPPMRQWMVDPATLCRKHLLGEHVEHHMFVGSFAKGVRAGKYVSENLLEFTSLQSRHDELVVEMDRRGYNHDSPLQTIPPCPQISDAEKRVKIDRKSARVELHRRCPECRERYSILRKVLSLP